MLVITSRTASIYNIMNLPDEIYDIIFLYIYPYKLTEICDTCEWIQYKVTNICRSKYFNKYPDQYIINKK